jgi:hypothetical protein
MEAKKEKPFKILIDHQPYEWEKSTITGSEIKVLAGVDPAYGVWQDIAGPTDPPVDDGQAVDLTNAGNERFFTGKKTTTEGACVVLAA